MIALVVACLAALSLALPFNANVDGDGDFYNGDINRKPYFDVKVLINIYFYIFTYI